MYEQVGVDITTNLIRCEFPKSYSKPMLGDDNAASTGKQSTHFDGHSKCMHWLLYKLQELNAGKLLPHTNFLRDRFSSQHPAVKTSAKMLSSNIYIDATHTGGRGHTDSNL